MKRCYFYLLFSLLSFTSFSQTGVPITLFEQFNGQLDFTAFGNTLNPFGNNEGQGFFNILDESSANLNLSPGQTLVRAYLYWGGAGPNEDFSVKLNGVNVDATRTFDAFVAPGYPIAFGGFADVTNIIQTFGNGTYTFSDLDLGLPENNGEVTKFGGWSVLVVYQDLSLTQNQVSIFDGFDILDFDIPNINITLNNINLGSTDSAKISFLSWEGDKSNNVQTSEIIRVNNFELINTLNPIGNAFNGTNTFDGNNQLYNMDLDFFSIDAFVSPGDTSIDIQMSTEFDGLFVNNIVTVVNSELPDATIIIDNIGVLCDNNDIDVNFTVFNLDSTAELPIATPIAFYADGVLVGQTVTAGIIPIGGSESGTITLNFPPGSVPTAFTLTAIVDDDGTGTNTGIVNENTEDNNSFDLVVELAEQALDIGPDVSVCANEMVTLGQDLGGNFTYQWFLNGVAIIGETSPFYNPTVSGTYRLDASQFVCFVTGEVEVTFQSLPPAIIPSKYSLCDEVPNDGFTTFDLTTKDAEITGGDTDFSVTYFTTLTGAQAGAFPITPSTAFVNTAIGFQIIYARVDNINT
ncbi:hypothetical protein, partial [Patiriisocius marinus]|uniref:hypothetical protein n=1 Tax=Patiriisocius marinus TaxID=1397112 RepID=UPI00233143AF